MIKKVAFWVLKLVTRIALKRNNYKIFAITGSVGKTTAKKAITAVLMKKYRVLPQASEGYNTEVGLPLVLIQRKVPKNLFGWFFLIFEAPFLAMKRTGYEAAVLEMGADRPGDIESLTSMIRPDVAVLTNIYPAHLNNFKDIREIAQEKAKIFNALTKNGVAITNNENEEAQKISIRQGITKMTFGCNDSDIVIKGQKIENHRSQNRFSVGEQEIIIDSKALGKNILYTFASAIAVGLAENISISDIKEALECFKPAKGRLNLIEGVGGSVIIDDSYNANPTSMKNAIDVLNHMEAKRKIAILGSMNELGALKEEEHKKIGEYLSGKCDILVTVGEAAKNFLAPSFKKTKDTIVKTFATSNEAGEYLLKLIYRGDVILAKGSQNKIRIERAVKIIMKNPEKASLILVRQGKEWEKRR